MTQLTTDNNSTQTLRPGGGNHTSPPPTAEPSETGQGGTGQSGPELSGLREYALLLWRKRVTVLVVAAICRRA